jgi:hypothetical protein
MGHRFRRVLEHVARGGCFLHNLYYRTQAVFGTGTVKPFPWYDMELAGFAEMAKDVSACMKLANRAFNIGFLASVCLFGVLNLLSYSAHGSRELFDHIGQHTIFGVDAYGFPFSFYFWQRIGDGSARLVWSELAADVVIAFNVSILIGLAFSFIRSKIQTPQD